MAKKKTAITFILNDEKKVNSYGFRVLNAGINQERFAKNPVILDVHVSWSNLRVIGRWENIRVEGSELKADAVFDLEDEYASQIAGKVERGFIKGCSIGFSYSDTDFEEEDSGTFVLVKCELFEASIVPLPSNSNAVRLYAKSGIPLEGDQIKLALDPIFNKNSSNKNQINTTMKNLNLSAGTMMVLGIDDTENSLAVAKAVETLADKHKALKVEHDALKSKEENRIKLATQKLVNDAVEAGKIKADEVETWVELGIANPDLFDRTLSALPGKGSLSDRVDNGEEKEMTIEGFQKLSAEDQKQFKNENPEQYQKLFA